MRWGAGRVFECTAAVSGGTQSQQQDSTASQRPGFRNAASMKRTLMYLLSPRLSRDLSSLQGGSTSVPACHMQPMELLPAWANLTQVRVCSVLSDPGVRARRCP